MFDSKKPRNHYNINKTIILFALSSILMFNMNLCLAHTISDANSINLGIHEDDMIIFNLSQYANYTDTQEINYDNIDYTTYVIDEIGFIENGDLNINYTLSVYSNHTE
ncbi:MAG: hypothetical protein ACTSVZ_05010, partial [Promethearchaeota archaeon]